MITPTSGLELVLEAFMAECKYVTGGNSAADRRCGNASSKD
jgi:hypothetical protein